MVELKNISLKYNIPHKKNTAALENVNAEFGEGKISVIIGPSGCGKTSLVRIMAGLLKPAKGEVIIRGNPVSGVSKSTAVIFQDYGLLPWKTVRANAELPLRFYRGIKTGGREAGRQKADGKKAGSREQKTGRLKNSRLKIGLLLEKFGLAGFAGHYPNQLSGGMKQRLAIVRALVTEPDLLLMDEPFSSLDAISREEAQDYFITVKKELKATIIMVTHSIEEAVYLGDAVYVMAGKNPGTLNQCRSYFEIKREGESNLRFRENPQFAEYCGLLRKTLKLPGREPQDRCAADAPCESGGNESGGSVQ
ncbi:MAG: ABC transporter ATP-binding protein [Treponema sp.]|nr:ABC transporter ATP-binding protein [Treponema sp.]